MLTQDQFELIFPHCDKDTTAEWTDAINQVLPDFEIYEGPRLWMFLAQCGHESSGFTTFEENLNYSQSGLLRVFPKYFDAATAHQYARKPQAIANRVYANRMGNGNEQSGDGWRYRGKGPIQITGKNNTVEFFKFYFPDDAEGCVPEMLLDPVVGITAACWFWNKNKLNELSDVENLYEVTRKINGGTNGMDDRNNRLIYIRQVLG